MTARKPSATPRRVLITGVSRGRGQAMAKAGRGAIVNCGSRSARATTASR